jgi:glucose/arabinose dehydrogenase
MKHLLFCALTFAGILYVQANVIDLPRGPLGDGPFILDTAEQHKIKVTVITKNLDRPFGMVFLPGGNILVSERGPGRLRIIRDGVLDPQPIGGVPKVNSRANAGLYDFVLHPKYAQNQWIYFAFSKPGEGMLSATVLARAKLQGNSLTQVQELYSTEQGTNVGGSRLAFALDGTILITTPAAGEVQKAQDPMSAYGKILRLNDDGAFRATIRLSANRAIARRSILRPSRSSGPGCASLGTIFTPNTVPMAATSEPDQARRQLRLAGHQLRAPI